MSELTLKMPSSYVNVDSDEMEYLDGGYYLSHNACAAIDMCLGMSICGGIAAMAGTIDACAGYLAGLLATSIPIGGLIAGGILVAIIWNQASSIASALFTDMFRRRGVDVGLGWFFCTPYLSFSPR